MSEPLRTYLHDHFSASSYTVRLLETLQREYGTAELGRFAKDILADVQVDRDILKALIQQIGSAGPDLKDATVWLAEKASRFKLRHEDPQGLGAFEALETLSLSLLGTRSLWKALEVIQEVDPRVSGFDFSDLALRAQEQFERVEQFRVLTARATFQRQPAAQEVT